MLPHIEIPYLENDLIISQLENEQWERPAAVGIDRYWNGEKAPESRHCTARLLWSADALYVRFDARQEELLIVSTKPNLETKTMGLWDRDVCEIFVTPDKGVPGKYLEFEAGPTGEWVDLAIDTTSESREVDWEYASGMQVHSEIGQRSFVVAMKIEWTAFGKIPAAGDVWMGNLFRCMGQNPDRGYLAWQPTMTKNPNFHVPEKFGRFVFNG